MTAATPAEAAAALGPLSNDQCIRIAALLSLVPAQRSGKAARR